MIHYNYIGRSLNTFCLSGDAHTNKVDNIGDVTCIRCLEKYYSTYQGEFKKDFNKIEFEVYNNSVVLFNLRRSFLNGLGQ